MCATRGHRSRLLVGFAALLTAGCALSPTPSPPPAAGQAGPAATYCAEQGGAVLTRYPAYDAYGANPLRLAGARQFCEFTAQDGSRISVALDTLHAEQPTLAAMAYLAKPPLKPGGAPGANPSSLYCTQLGGTDLFGGVSAAGGGWVAEGKADDVLAECVFPDLSSIDSWGLTYHSNGTIRGADLTAKFRYRPTTPPPAFSASVAPAGG
jgi:putative hemolysin